MSKKTQQYAKQLTSLLQVPAQYITHRTSGYGTEKGFNINGREFYISFHSYPEAWDTFYTVLGSLLDIMKDDCNHAKRFMTFDESETEKKYGKQHYTPEEWQKILLDNRKSAEYHAEKVHELEKWISVLLEVQYILSEIPA